MQQHIAIGMGQQAESVGNAHAAEGDEFTLGETVHIIAVANTHRSAHSEVET